MAYVPKIFKDRSVEFPFRRLLAPVSGMANTVDVSRVPGTIFEVGDEPDATNLNAEFDKIKNETDAINNSLNGTTLWINASPTSTFDAQTVPLSSPISNFKYYEVKYLGQNTLNQAYTTGKIPIEYITRLPMVSASTIFREITAVSGSSIAFALAKTYATYASGEAAINAYCIPLIVIGYMG